MSVSMVTTLPLPQRLALSYAPERARAQQLALFALDARLGQAVRQANEPLAGQLRLAWWREQLTLDPERRERSDELMDLLDLLPDSTGPLIELVDGWEMLLGEQLGSLVISAFADARAGAFAGIADINAKDAVLRAARRWAIADLAAGLGKEEEKQAAVETAKLEADGRTRLPRAFRPIAVLEGLARRSLARGGESLLDGPGSLLLAMRLGLLGR